MRIAGLDVLRGIAVAFVMARHALPDVFPGGGRRCGDLRRAERLPRHWCDPDIACSLPTTWALCFVVGAAAQVLVRSREVSVPSVAWVMAALGLVVLCVIPLRGNALTYLAGGPAIAALTVVLVLAWRTWLEATGSLMVAVAALGTVSYAAYLWNYPVTLWLEQIHEAGRLVAVPVTLVLAVLSWRLVERRFSRRPALVRA